MKGRGSPDADRNMNTPSFTKTLWVLFLCLGAAACAWAHAVVVATSLNGQPLKAKTPNDVALEFNSQVELSLSRAFLVSAGDRHQPVPLARGARPGQVLVRLPALDAGEYAIRYKVFASDGHLTEDVVRFNVE